VKLLLACFKFSYHQNLLLLSFINRSSNDNFYNKVNFGGHKFLAESFICNCLVYAQNAVTKQCKILKSQRQVEEKR